MSVYDERPRHRETRTRTREPEYIETEDTYIARGNRTQDLALRPRHDEYDDDYPAEIRRRSYREDYGPPRARSHGQPRDPHYDDDYYSDYSPRSRRGRRDRDDDYDDYDDRAPRERRKSKVEEALGAVGLGGVVSQVMDKARSKSRRRHSGDYDRYDRDRGYSRSRSRDGGSRSEETRKKWQQAAKAAVITGIIETVRSRNEPGGWTGPKGQRIATAALGAAGIDGFLDRDPNDRSKRHIVESVVGGLAAGRIANGPRDQSGSRGRSQSRGGRSRSVIDRLRSRSRSVFGRNRSGSPDSRGRSQSRGPGLKEAAGLAGVAAVGKAIYDRVRSKSRGRLNRSRSRSAGSVDSYVPSRRPRYAQQHDRGGYADENAQVTRGRSAEQEADGEDRGARSSSSSSVSTTDLEEQRKKLLGKELLTAGLATVATIHAAHGVYSSMVASEKRHKMVMEGKLSQEEARKRKSKNMLQDAAAVGIAALGIKSAFAEWKDMNEKRQHKHDLEKRKRRHKKAQERRRSEMREMRMQQYPPYAQAPQYGDANPYQSYNGNLPPPPVGGYAR